MPSTRSTINLLKCGGANKGVSTGISYICYEADLQYKNLKKLTKKRLVWDHVLHPYPPNKKIKIANAFIPEPAVLLSPCPSLTPAFIPEPAVLLSPCPSLTPAFIPEPAVLLSLCPSLTPAFIPEPAVLLSPCLSLTPAFTQEPDVPLSPCSTVTSEFIDQTFFDTENARIKMLICKNKENIKSARADMARRRKFLAKSTDYVKLEKANLAQLRRNVTFYFSRIKALKEEIL